MAARNGPTPQFPAELNRIMTTARREGRQDEDGEWKMEDGDSTEAESAKMPKYERRCAGKCGYVRLCAAMCGFWENGARNCETGGVG
jgi:hypothetical protein